MPIWLIRFLPHIAIAAILLFGVWKIDSNGFRRAQREAERRELTQAVLIARAEKRLSKQMAAEMGEVDRQLTAKLGRIAKAERSVLPSIQKEIRNDPRYTAPACALSDGMLRALNAARAAGNDPPAAGERP